MKKFSKSILCLLLALCLMSSLAACGNKNTDETTQAPVKADYSAKAEKVAVKFAEKHNAFELSDAAELCVDSDAYYEAFEESGMPDDIKDFDDMIDYVVANSPSSQPESYVRVLFTCYYDALAADEFEAVETVEEDGVYTVTVEYKKYDETDIKAAITNAEYAVNTYAATNGISSYNDSPTTLNKVFKDSFYAELATCSTKTEEQDVVIVIEDGEALVDYEACDFD